MTTRLLTLGAMLALVACSTALVVRQSRATGVTFDEPFYLAEGLTSWRTGSNRALMTAGTMPLPVDVLTLPVYLHERSRDRPVHPVNELTEVLPLARHANLVFWWLLLLYAGLWGRRLAGITGALFGVAFLAFEPSLLAHAALATTDVAACWSVLALGYHFAQTRSARPAVRLGVPGLFFAVALATKASALAFGPLVLATIGLASVTPEVRWKRATLTRLVRDLAIIGALGVLGMLAYVGCDYRAEPSFVAWAHGLPESPWRTPVLSVAESLTLFPNGLEGLVQQVKHNARGHGVYVLGEYHPRAVWHYFPVTLSAKLPTAVLILTLLTLLTRPRAEWPLTGAVVLVLLAFSLSCRVQIGVRLVFPLVAFLAVTLAGAWPPTRVGILVRGVTLALIVAETLASGAGRLGFVNQLWGGPRRAHAVMADSNHDWGQGLPDLAAWHADRPDADRVPLYAWYYGTDPRVLLHPVNVKMVHTWPDPSPERLTRETANGYLAVGHSLLTACPDRRPATVSLVDWLHTQPVVGRTECFTVYRLGGT